MFSRVALVAALSVAASSCKDEGKASEGAGDTASNADGEKADGEKCQRCWKILPDVGNHKHDGVCGRCDAALG